MVSVALTRKDTTMLLLPSDMIALLLPFAPLFSPAVFPHAQRLLVGALDLVGWRGSQHVPVAVERELVL